MSNINEHRNVSPPVPLYYRVKAYLKDQIESGALRPGDQVPTEEQLSEFFHVSRMTARRAVDELAREGRLIRRQGVGTFVAEPVIKRELARLTTLSEEVQRLGFSGLHSRYLAWRVFPAPRSLGEIFGMPAGDPVLLIVRVRYTGDVPIAAQTIYLSAHLTHGLQPADVEKQSIYQILEERFRLSIGWSKQRIDAVAASRFQAKWLEVVPGSPLLKVTRQAFLTDGQPFELAKTYYRSDRYSFYVNLNRG